MTSQPLNQSELQLYRVLQRANLLAYYDTFICQGGDDVQQLCEAGEDEFLEIMALVGMASKPLHVRRLQKALQEWVKNPDMFTGPPPAGFASGPHHSHQNGTGNAPPPPPPVLVASTALPAPIGAAVDRSPSGPNGSSCIPSLTLGSNSVSPRRESMAAALVGRNRSDRQASSSASIGSTSGALSPINFSTPPFVGNPGSNSGPNGNTCVPHITSPTGIGGGHSSSLGGSGGPNHSGHPGVTVIASGSSTGGAGGGGGGGVLQSNCPSGGTSSHSTPSPTAKESNNHFTPNSLSLALSMAQHQVNQDRNRERMRAWMEGQTGQHVVNDSNQQFTLGSNTREGLITNEYGQPASPVSLTPVLLDSQIQRLADAAESLIKALPPSLDVKLTSNKKRISKELEHVLNMAEDDPRRLDEIRKYAAIYGRFDCKRKPEKPLTLHEVSVNEAAAQICKHIPALLTRRDELFPLARQVVRDSGYQYSKGHSRSQSNLKRTLEEAGLVSNNGCNKFFNSSTSNDTSKVDTDDTDSQYSLYSNPSESQSNDAAESNGGHQGGGSSGSIHSSNCQSDGNICGSNGNENFSKLLPAKKSGNFGGAAQIAKQLVQETLLDEGLRVVKEFTGGNSNGSDDCINSSNNGGNSGSICHGRNGPSGSAGGGGENGSNCSTSSNGNSNDGTSPSPPKKELRSSNCISSPGNPSSNIHHQHSHHSLSHASLHQMDHLDGPNGASALITGETLGSGHSSQANATAHLLGGNVNPSVLFSNGHILPPGPPPSVMSHRPRGRPPKAITDLRNLEAAYHEKLTQHLQQSFLASQAYNQVIQAAAVAAAANGFTSATTSPANGSVGPGGGGVGHSSAASLGAMVTGAGLGGHSQPSAGHLNGDMVVVTGEGNRSLKAEQMDNQLHHSIQVTGDMVDTATAAAVTGHLNHPNHANHSASSVTRTNGFHSQSQASKDLPLDTDILVTDLSVNSTSTLSTRPPVTSSPNLASEGENNASSTSSHFTDH